MIGMIASTVFGGGGHGGHEYDEHYEKPANYTMSYEEWCYSITSHNLYALGSRLYCNTNEQVVFVAAIFLIIITVIFEVSTHSLEHYLHHKSKVAYTMLQTIYKEIMLFGVLSFALEFIQSWHATDYFFLIWDAIWGNELFEGESIHMRNERRIILYSFVHVMLVYLCFFYVVFSIFMICGIFIFTSSWKKNEEKEIKPHETDEEYDDDHHHHHDHHHDHGHSKGNKALEVAKKKYKDACVKIKSFANLINPYFLYQFSNISMEINYLLVRKRFVEENNLKKNFKFYKYLHKCKVHLLVELLEVHYVTWLVILAFVVLGYIRLQFKILLLDTLLGGYLNFMIFVVLVSVILVIVTYAGIRIGYCVYTRLIPKLSEKIRTQKIFYKIILKLPHLAIYALQLVILLQALFVTLMFAVFFYTIFWEHAISCNIIVNIAVFVGSFIPSIFVCVFLVLIIPPFVIMNSIEYLTKKKIVHEMKEQRLMKIVKAEVKKRMEDEEKEIKQMKITPEEGTIDVQKEEKEGEVELKDIKVKDETDTQSDSDSLSSDSKSDSSFSESETE